jgi:hypothetical protein
MMWKNLTAACLEGSCTWNTSGQSYLVILNLLEERKAEHELLVSASWCHYQALKYLQLLTTYII